MQKQQIMTKSINIVKIIEEVNIMSKNGKFSTKNLNITKVS